MDDKEIKESVERLFNTLGTDLFKSLYNKEFHFEITNILRDSPIYTLSLMIYVKTDKPIPSTLRNMKVELWRQYRYVTPDFISINLERLLKYVGLYNTGVFIEDIPYEYKAPKVKPNDYIKNPQNFTTLVDETWVLNNNTGIVYPLLLSNKIDTRSGFHLQNIEEDEWWNSLTEEDKINLDSLYS